MFRWILRNFMLVLCLVGGIVTMVLWETGTMQQTMQAQYGEEGPPPLPSPEELFLRMPGEQWVPLALAAAVWMLGVPALIILQGRKVGRPWRESFLAHPFYRDFDVTAWVIFGVLVVSSLWLGSLALSHSSAG